MDQSIEEGIGVGEVEITRKRTFKMGDLIINTKKYNPLIIYKLKNI